MLIIIIIIMVGLRSNNKMTFFINWHHQSSIFYITFSIRFSQGLWSLSSSLKPSAISTFESTFFIYILQFLLILLSLAGYFFQKREFNLFLKSSFANHFLELRCWSFVEVQKFFSEFLNLSFYFILFWSF